MGEVLSSACAVVCASWSFASMAASKAFVAAGAINVCSRAAQWQAIDRSIHLARERVQLLVGPEYLFAAWVSF